MAIRLIAIDMDGTLVHSGGHISSRNRAALLAAKRSGIDVVIATGRRHIYAMKLLHDLGLAPEDVLLTSNGTVARTVSGKLLFRNTLPRESTAWLIEQLDDLRNAFVLTYDMVDERGHELPGALVLEDLEHLHGSIANWMRANASAMRRVDRLEAILEEGFFPAEEHGNGHVRSVDERSTQAPIQAMLCGTVARMDGAHHLLRRGEGSHIQMHRTEYPARDLCILDILPQGCSKGAALLRLGKDRGIGSEEIMCIGDNWNDLAMLEIAGYPVVMGNAPEPLLDLAQERGWHTTSTHDEDGVAEAIEAVLRRQVALAS